MDLLATVRKNPRLKSLAKRFLQLRLEPNAFYRLLRAEWTLRHTLGYELLRIFYYQPMFEVSCASVGEGTRLEITPDSKVPTVDRCAVIIGNRCRINARISFSGAAKAPSLPKIEIGDDTYTGSRVVLRAGLGIRIGKRTLIGSNVLIQSDPAHPKDPVARRDQPAPAEELQQITIGDDCWVGEGSTVIGQVTIGDGAIVATKAVVTKDVPPYTVVAGVPAKIVKHLVPPLKAVAG